MLAAGWCALAVAACNEILDNRRGVLRRETETTEAAPTHPAKTGDETATTPGGSSADDSYPAPPDAAAQGARADAASACPPGLEGTSKSCGTRCVSVNDPAYGCAAPDCTPCNLPGAVPACVDGACAIFACTGGRADCNANPVDGCESDLLSTATCGACSNVCPSYPHAIASCIGTCTFECAPGWADCDGAPLDGCEVNLAEDPVNCGQCGRGCLFGGCNAGHCVLF